MKLAFISALLFLVLAAAPTTSFGQLVPVRDIDGDIIIPGDEYFVMPAVPGLSSGLTATDPKSCKTDVIQSLNPGDFGLRVRFLPSKLSSTIVPQSSDLNVEFSPELFSCSGSSVWMIDQTSDEGYVTTGGFKQDFGPEGITSWLQIEKVNDVAGYKFKFCETVCMDLGISVGGDGTTRHLALGKAVVNFQFRKAF